MVSRGELLLTRAQVLRQRGDSQAVTNLTDARTWVEGTAAKLPSEWQASFLELPVVRAIRHAEGTLS